MDISFEGWNTEVANNVYSRKQGEGMEIAVVSRFRIPFKKEVFQFLRQKCETHSSRPHILTPGGPAAKPVETLDDLLGLFSQKIVYDIGQSKPNYLAFFNQVMPVSGSLVQQEAVEPPRFNYVQIVDGILPKEVLTDANLKKMRADPILFLGVLGEVQLRLAGLGEKIRVSILTYENQLIPREDVNILLRYNTNDSDGLVVLPKGYNPQLAMQLVDMMYSTLDTPEKVQTVKDMSQALIEGHAYSAMNTLFIQLAAQQQGAR